MSSTRPFLSLPPEIRNSIYDYCTPINGPISSYDGLRLSCKQVSAELPVRALATYNSLIGDVRNTLAAKSCRVTISRPSSYTNNIPDGIGHISFFIGDIRNQLPYDLVDMLVPLISPHYMHFHVAHTHIANNQYARDLRRKINRLIAQAVLGQSNLRP